MFKGLMSFLAISLCIFLMSATGVKASENLIFNPGFEEDMNLDGVPDGWRTNVQGEPASFKWDSSVKETGNYSVMVERKGPGLKGQARWYQFIPVEAGIEYQVSFSYKTGDDFSGKADVMVAGCGVGYRSYWILRPSSEAAGGWKKLQFNFCPKESGKIGLYLQHRGKGRIWYDNIRLEKVSTSWVTTNFLPNPGFENTKPDGTPSGGWWLYPAWVVQKNFAKKLSIDNINPHSGNYSVKMEVMAKTCPIALVSPYFSVNPGDKLYIGAFCRGKAENPEKETFQLMIGYRSSQGVSVKRDTVKGKVTPEWEKIEGTFVVPEGIAFADFNLVLPAGFVGEFFVDDVVLKKVNNYSLNLSPYEENVSLGINKLKFLLSNYTQAKDELKMILFLDGSVIASKKFTPTGVRSEKGEIEYEVKIPGRHKVELSLFDPKKNKVLFVGRKNIVVSELMQTSLIQPTYVWPGEKEVKEDIKINLPSPQLKESRVVIRVEKKDKLIKEEEIFPISSAFTYSFPVVGLGAGDYQMKIKLLNRDKKTLALRKEIFHIMGHPRPTVKIAQNGNLLINNKPFFPIGMFHAPISEEYAKAGFNVIHNYAFEGDWYNEARTLASDRKCMTMLDKAKELGLWSIIGTPRVKLVKNDWEGLRKRFMVLGNHPTVLCYEEEEQMARGVCSFGKMKKWYALIKEIDPDRPVLVGDMPKHHDPKWLFAEDFMDIGIWWWYPFPLKDGQTEIIPPAWLIRNVSAIKKPIWIALQSDTLFVYQSQGLQDADARELAKSSPTDKEYRCQAYLAIIYGAKGLMYFSSRVLLFPERWDSLKKLVGELKDMSPVFLSPTSEVKIKKTGGDKISTMLKKYNGTYYLIAANRDKANSNVTFHFPFQPKKIKVRYEDREISPEKQSFKDHFSSYEVHIYEIKE